MFKNIKRFIYYVKTIKKNLPDIKKNIIEQNEKYIITDIKYDSIYRVYTVVNFNNTIINEFKKLGGTILQKEIKTFISKLNNEFKKVGLMEYIVLSKIDRVSKFSVLVVVECKFFSLKKFIKRLISFLLAGIIITVAFLIFI